MFWGLPDPHPDPLVKDMDPDSSIIKHRGNFGADPDPTPTPDPTTFLSDFEDVKKLFFSYFFLIAYLRAHYFQY
jgi:hypothetical protein